MSYTTINKSTDYFNTNLYTGNNTETSHTGIGFQPDLTWLKVRNASGAHYWFDAVRGATNYIRSDNSAAEGTLAETLKSFDSDGYTVGTSNSVNTNGETMVGWNWLGANGTSANTDGTISSTVSANTTSGFSIVSYTGTGANATVGHGLGSAPKMVIVKDRDNGTYAWHVYHVGVGATKTIYLNLTNTPDTSSAYWNDTAPTTSVFSVGTSVTTNNSGDNFIAYCFAEKQGYSKFGSYTGNGSTDGTFVYTGFTPAWTLIKRTDSSTGGSWILFDNKRGTNVINPVDVVMAASNTQSESDWGTTYDCDYLSNGFKWRHDGSSGYVNVSGATYIFMAFAENPFVTSTGVPATAR
jgi:hypothetical protein